MACHGATKVSPYQLVYGHEAILPWELKTGSRRVTFQDQLTTDEYAALMKDELEDLVGHRLKALINVEANKARVARWYDKKVKIREFVQGELVWKHILLIGTKDSKFGKWSLLVVDIHHVYHQHFMHFHISCVLFDVNLLYTNEFHKF
jgi:hypothetical protein